MMADVVIARDIEGALVADLSAIASSLGLDIAFSGTPVSPELGRGQSLPYVVLSLVGGDRRSVVVDERQLVADVYDATWADAARSAGLVVGLLTSLPMRSDTSTHWPDVRIDTLPYELPDTGEPSIPRMRMLVTAITRGEVAAL